MDQKKSEALSKEVIDLREQGFGSIECSSCFGFKWRKQIGESPNGRRKYYQDEAGKAWRGKSCPDCAKKQHTEYMRKYRSKKQGQSDVQLSE